jgi:enamine deaminase RidA (YjgF/YER057c/UK114 family)
MIVEQRLIELGITLRPAAVPIGSYVSWQRDGDMLYFSGAGPMRDGKPTVSGRLGDDITIEQGYAAARESAINLVCALKAAIGDLDKVAQIVKVLGFVRATPEFTQQPAVINGASDLLVEVFGDRGRHARSAVGVSSLPGGIPVEVEMIVRVKGEC